MCYSEAHARIRAEHDILARNKKTTGNRWKFSGGFLTRQTLIGVLARKNGELLLTFRLFNSLNASPVTEKGFVLPGEVEQWKDILSRELSTI